MWPGTAPRRADRLHGEDGFEVYLEPSAAPKLWRALLAEGGPKGCSRPASAPATPSGSRRGCHSTAMTSTTQRRRWRLAWAGSSSSTRRLHRRDVLERSRRPHRAPAGRLRAALSRHRAARPPGTAGRGDGEPVGHVTSGTRLPRSASRWAWPTCRLLRRRPGGSFRRHPRPARAARIVELPFYSRKKKS